MQDLDTGSADLWVYGEGSVAAGTGHTIFTPASTFKTIPNYSWKVQYGDNSTASGYVGTDKVTIGTATVAAQIVEVATTVDATLANQHCDGMLGLAFSGDNSVSPEPQKTFFDNLKDQLEQPVLTASLGANGEGEYEFGAVDMTKCTGEITYTPINTTSLLWQFDSTSYQINGTTYAKSNAEQAIADTGTSLLLVTDDVVRAYYGSIAGAKLDTTQNMYTVPCTIDAATGVGSNPDLPPFGVAIGDSGYYATLSGNQIIYAALTDSCAGAIQSNGGSGIQVFGDILLRSQFVVFDISVPQIGFAKAA